MWTLNLSDQLIMAFNGSCFITSMYPLLSNTKMTMTIQSFRNTTTHFCFVVRVIKLFPELASHKTPNAEVNRRPCAAWASALNVQLG